MTDTQQATPEASAPTTEAQAPTTIDERMSALAEALTPAGEDSDYATDAPAKKSAKADDDAKPEKVEASEVDAAKAERHQRREALRKAAAERNEFVERRKQQSVGQQSQQEVAQLQAEVQRLKGLEAAMRDPARFFEVASTVADPRELSQWLEKAVNDPSAIVSEAAAKRAREAVSPELEAMKAKVEAMERTYEAQTQQARVAQERAAEAEFISHASRQGEDTAVAVWREAFGDSQLITLANNLLPELPEGSSMADLLDIVEERCASIIQRLHRNPSKQPKKPEQPAQKNISARARADRTEIEDPEAAMASLSVDERFRLLAQQLNNSR